MNQITGIWDRVWKAFQSLFMEDAYITRVYYESMRDNFDGYDVTHDVDGFTALRDEFQSFAPGGEHQVTLGQLFRIEVALLRHLPNSAIEARFWSIDDRFRRVVPQSVIDSYDRRTPLQGDQKWSDVDFVRNQSRSLLDVIHANYLINLGREQSTKRLMFIIAMAALAILAISAGVTSITDGHEGLVVLAVAGMFGAMISIVNRLQKATSRDAMAQDGIFELIGLRTGWVSILMSICIGGVFSLVLYAMVMGGLSDNIFPRLAPSDQMENGNEDTGNGKDADSELLADGEAAEGSESGAAQAAQEPEGQAASAPAVAAAQTAASAQGAAKSVLPKASSGSPDTKDSAGDGDHPKIGQPAGCWIDRIVKSLHFPSHEEFYKMLVFAFLAGFAERFVPDILNRLSKQGKSS